MRLKPIIAQNRKAISLLKKANIAHTTTIPPQYVSLENLEDDFIMLKPYIKSDYPIYSVSANSKIKRRADFIRSLDSHHGLDALYSEHLEKLRIDILSSITDFGDVEAILPIYHNTELIDFAKKHMRYVAPSQNPETNSAFFSPLINACKNIEVEAAYIATLYQQNKDIAIVVNDRNLNRAITHELYGMGCYLSRFHKLSHFHAFDLFLSIIDLLLNYKADADLEKFLLNPLCKYHLYSNGLSALDKSHNEISNVLNSLKHDTAFCDFFKTCRRGSFNALNTLIKSASYFLDKFLKWDGCDLLLRNQITNFLNDLKAQDLNLRCDIYNIKEIITFLANDYTLKEEGTDNALIISSAEIEYLPEQTRIIFSDTSFNQEVDFDGKTINYQKGIYKVLQSRQNVSITFSEHVDGSTFSQSTPLIALDSKHRSKIMMEDIEISTNRISAAIIPNTFPKRLSVSAIEKLIRSPYVFAAEYILGIKSRRSIFERNFYIDFGVYIHKAFEQLDFTCSSDDIKAQLETSLSALVPEHFSAFEKFAIQRAVQSLTSVFDAIDLSRSSEALKEYTLELLLDEVDVTITARADLILEKDETHIIDFKTGSIPTLNDIKSGYYPQLMIEDMIVNKENSKKYYICASLSDVSVREIKLDACNIYQELLRLITLFNQPCSVFFAPQNAMDDVKIKDFKHMIRY